MELGNKEEEREVHVVNSMLTLLALVHVLATALNTQLSSQQIKCNWSSVSIVLITDSHGICQAKIVPLDDVRLSNIDFYSISKP